MKLFVNVLHREVTKFYPFLKKITVDLLTRRVVYLPW
jgi:hypothetical protein